MPSGTVVIVGRPNVGKSTLFNRLTRSRKALVHDLPGVTRDRIIAEAPRQGGGTMVLIDTGGLVFAGEEDHWLPKIRSQAEIALRDADAVILLADGAAGVLPDDDALASWLHELGTPVVVAVNKSDRKEVELQAAEFSALGFGEPIAVSAEHGLGIGELGDRLEELLPPPEDEQEVDPDAEIRVAIIGRPNVGKSSLLNRFAGDERAMVSDVAGTTRDAVDTVVVTADGRFRFVDTAGIRRKGRTEKGPEVLSVVIARRQIEDASVCLLLIDATEGITNQDAHVAGYAWEAGKAVLIAVNKWDLVEEPDAMRAELELQMERHMAYLKGSQLVSISALTGKRAARLLPAIAELDARHGLRVKTAELNNVLRDAWARKPPPSRAKAQTKLFFTTQIGRRPPVFVLQASVRGQLHFSYTRYIENTLRAAFGLAGVPIKVIIRSKSRSGSKAK